MGQQMSVGELRLRRVRSARLDGVAGGGAGVVDDGHATRSRPPRGRLRRTYEYRLPP